MELKHSYLIDIEKFSDLKTNITLNEYNYYPLNEDTLIVQLTKKEANTLPKLKRYYKNEIDQEIRKIYKKDWNEDNFGPLVIPKEYLFVLGDNRNYSIDSRFQGLIPVDNLKGKLILK
jgi:signal peptidase I